MTVDSEKETAQGRAMASFRDTWNSESVERKVLDILKGEADKRGIPSDDLGNHNGSLFLRNGDGNELCFEFDDPSWSISCKMKVNGRASAPEFFGDATVFMAQVIKEKAVLYTREVASLGHE